MTDKELLELAAKASGVEAVRSRLDDPLHKDFLVKNSERNHGQATGQWNPLADDGDALRLAVKLRLDVYVDSNMTEAVYLDRVTEAHLNDPYAATRRAITRAAAAIGRTM